MQVSIISDISYSGEMTTRPRGRPKVNHEAMAARFPEGTLARIDAVRLPNETRTEFVQRAVDLLVEFRTIDQKGRPKKGAGGK